MKIPPLSRLAGAGLSLFLTLAPGLASAEEPWTSVLAHGEFAPDASKDGAPPGTGWELEGDEVLTFDRSSEEGSFFFITYPLDFDESRTLVVEARGRVKSGMNGIIVSSKSTVVGLRFLPHEITWRDRKKSSAQNTESEFHTYRIVMSPSQVRVEMDGSPLFEGDPVDKKEPDKKMRIAFGSGNSSNEGEALWEFVRFRFE